ncbi:MAG: hypothetical protein EZS28_035402 [Streblomastix strix]|uniref:Uncharacterized protein n=1 Tax=Streblomastix strix TaxID=222440 RepID=A0A5J4UG63_9EUKA|nr:MAG: hypothetical protein EZS28_035402 [Streblomastix strix]
MCLDFIHKWGDEQIQVELVTNGYPRVLVSIINTPGGNEQEQDRGIDQGLINIFRCIRVILKGRAYLGPSLPPYPVLFKQCLEQFEDEGGNEEIEAQLVNKCKGYYYDVKDDANRAKEKILNIFVNWSNGWQW